jgi:tRNA(Ile2) C34 agmatinyltransferase TiaS
MPQVRSSEPSLVPTERPRCPRCQGRMMLAQIEFRPAHCDLRTFECSKCSHVHRMLVGGPMGSDNPGAQNSELKPPK